MERKIGDTFQHEGKQLKVVENKCGLCDGCFFMRTCNVSLDEKLGFCEPDSRSDNKKVIFVEVQPQQTEKPKELNLCELLRHCPKDEQFWSPMLGDVIFYGINQSEGIVRVEMENGEILGINSDGTITIYGITSPEVMLYPSREQRDWTKVKYEPKNVLPRSWEEFCVTHDITMSEYFIGETGNIFNSNSGKRIPEISKTILPSEQAAEAHLAYMQLHQLRNAWREGWTPDWTDNTQAKFAIIYNKDEYIVFNCRFINRFLSFQDETRATEFLQCYKGLIKKAGDLI